MTDGQHEPPTDSTEVYIGDEIERAVNDLLPDGENAADLLGQADVWLETKLLGNYLHVEIDYDRLRETTDYGDDDE